MSLASACQDNSSKPAPSGEAKPATTTATAASAAPVAKAPGDTTIKEKAPSVPGAAEAKKFTGAKITYYGESVGQGAELDKILAKQFQADTGIEVNVIPRPKSSDDTQATYQRFFQAQSADIDVMMLDVIWPGPFAQNLLDLSAKLGEAAKQHIESIVQNNTVGGKLVAMPFFTDFPLLFSRTDLLEKYGFKKPPETWDELEQMAKKIQDGEKASNPNFAGFVWQGKAYEGLTCNALEWIASHGGGTIIENGKVTLNNPKAEKALSRAKAWIGGISPKGVTNYEEEDARNAFQSGNAAFMRNWPYAYASGNTDNSPIKGKFGVSPLPHEPGEKSAGTIGGWGLGVSKFSKKADAAVEYVRYLTSPEVQKFRAIVGSFGPTIRSVQADADVLKALPFLEGAKDAGLVARPAGQAGSRYVEASTAFYQGVSQVLQGKAVKDVLGQTVPRIERVLR
jgi:trehalose/maltose transport system substrate-binding protein